MMYSTNYMFWNSKQKNVLFLFSFFLGGGGEMAMTTTKFLILNKNNYQDQDTVEA